MATRMQEKASRGAAAPVTAPIFCALIELDDNFLAGKIMVASSFKNLRAYLDYAGQITYAGHTQIVLLPGALKRNC